MKWTWSWTVHESSESIEKTKAIAKRLGVRWRKEGLGDHFFRVIIDGDSREQFESFVAEEADAGIYSRKTYAEVSLGKK